MRAVLTTLASLTLAMSLSACHKPAAKAPMALPTPIAQQTFKDCKWGHVQGRTLSIWSYACGPAYGGLHLVADESLPGFALVSGEPESQSYAAVIRTFTKEATASMDTVLPEVRKLSPGPHTATCEFFPALDPTDEHSTRRLFELAPTGAAKMEWDLNLKSSNDGDPPCGPLGVSLAGSRVFEVMKDDPMRVVYIDYGSEIQIFDTATLTALK